MYRVCFPREGHTSDIHRRGKWACLRGIYNHRPLLTRPCYLVAKGDDLYRWTGLVLMAPLTVKKSLQQFRSLQQKLTERLEELMRKKDTLDLVLTTRSPTEPHPKKTLELSTCPIGTAAKHENDRLTSAATDILIEILELKVNYVEECVQKLEEKARVDPRSLAPMELRVVRFEDWVETNQRLYQLNSKLYEIEKVKVNVERRESKFRRPVSLEQPDASTWTTVSEVAATSLLRIVSRYSSSMPKDLQLYVSNRLKPRGNRETLEASKIEEYIEECRSYPGTMDEPPMDSNGQSASVCLSVCFFVCQFCDVVHSGGVAH